MKDKDFVFVRNYMKQYYTNKRLNVWIPSPVREREFGFTLGPNRVMMRHRGFEDESTVRDFLSSEAPLDAYHSAALYDSPTANMDEKGFRGADLFFDIDADHISSDCVKNSSVWICNRCSEVRADVMETCPRCGKGVDLVSFPNVECIEVAREEALKLTMILADEFGVREEEMRAHYSGNRGFHVYVFSEGLRQLGGDARKEIIDYITEPSSDLDLLLVRSPDKREVYASTAGLPGRVLEGMKAAITDRNSLASLTGPKVAARVYGKRDQLLSELETGKLTTLIRTMGGKNFEGLFKEMLSRNRIKVDPVVTIDLHRLVRMPGSINSKTGFPKDQVDLKRTNAASILDAMRTTGKPVKVLVRAAPKIQVGGAVYGPYENLIEDLPEEVAALLILRGVAEVVV